MERSQSRLSLSASFEALAIYFPCMNSFDDEDAGERASVHPPREAVPGYRCLGPSGTRGARERRLQSTLHSWSLPDRYPGVLSTPSGPQGSRISSGPAPPPQEPVDHLHASVSRRWALGPPGLNSSYLCVPTGLPGDPTCHHLSLVYGP